MRRARSRVAALGAATLSAVLTATFLPSASPSVSAVPALRVSTVVGGLSQPWDVAPLPDGSLLVTERDSRRLLRVVDGVARPVSYPSSSVWVSGETGLMGLVVDPAFASNRRFYTCQGGFNSAVRGGHDVRVVAWRLSDDATSATQSAVVVKGLPATSGRHGGCRLLMTPTNRLLIGTGDAAVGTNPRNLRSLGGKVLRVDRMTGAPAPGNPWPKNASLDRRKVLTYGHRNVQGLAVRGSELWSVEHGSSRDDEVNRLAAGGDYGWNPVPGYNESRPMTDGGLPGTQRAAKWRSGSTTIATSGAAFVTGSRWGDLTGTLAVAALKGQRMLFLRFDGSDRLRATTVPDELRRFGRLRSVVQLPGGGDLLVTTANGGGQDRVLRVTPG
ncbi:PQQ-dependent sugar dehydrogenase [Nocardioides marmoraquaticus]